MTLARPASIVWFERLILGSLLVGIVDLVLNWKDLLGTESPVALIVSHAIGVGITLFLVGLVSRKRSNPAKWIFVGLFGLSLILAIATMIDQEASPPWTPGAVLILALEAVALALLFSKSARSWFAKTDLLTDAELRQTFD